MLTRSKRLSSRLLGIVRWSKFQERPKRVTSSMHNLGGGKGISSDCSRNFSSFSSCHLLLSSPCRRMSSYQQSDTEKEPIEEEPELIDDGSVQYTLNLTDQELHQITQGDAELEKKVKYIQLEHEVYRQEGMRVPSKVKLSQWKELLPLKTPSARRKYYSYLFLNEMKSEKDKMKKEEKRRQRLETLPPLPSPEEDPVGLTYGLTRNTIFLRLYDSTINKFYYNKLINAMMYSRPLVIDCGYDEFMTPREAKNCAKQLELLISENRTHKQPFDLHFMNADPDSKMMQYLKKIIPIMHDDSYPINLTSKSYLDVFPKKQLVYLSPHARETLNEFSEDEIYIVGAMVDKSDPRPFSLAKAKKENVTMKKLPLDNYLVWGMGSKSLTLNQMVRIMLDLRLTQDWNVALDHVPKRKLQREFHPYPPKDGSEPEQGMQEPEPPYFQRRETKSRVLEDFELINQRKGFQRSSGGYTTDAYRPRDYPDRRENNYNKSKSRKFSIRIDDLK